LTGARRRTPVQFADYWPEPGDPEMTAFYDHLLSLLPQTVIGRGEMEFCDTGLPPCFAMKWKDDSGGSIWCWSTSPRNAPVSKSGKWNAGMEIADLYSHSNSTWDWKGESLHIDLAPCGFELLELRPNSQ
jgi:hypothetical protein